MNHSTRYLLTISTLALLFLAGCAKGPEQTVKTFYYSVEAGEIDKAVNMLSGEIVNTLGRDKIRSALVQQTREISQKGGISGIVITSSEVTEQTADLGVRVEYGNGDSTEETIQLTKIDGEWKMSPELNK